MLEKQDADAFAEQLAGATMRVVRDYEDEDVVGEPAFSDQLCGRLKESLEEFETETIRWQVDVAAHLKGFGRLKARTLSPWKEEPELGADIVMVLDVDTPEFVVRKGLLAQAKRLEPGKWIDSGEHRRLIEQCEKMLYVTPASMVFLGAVKPTYRLAREPSRVGVFRRLSYAGRAVSAASSLGIFRGRLPFSRETAGKRARSSPSIGHVQLL